MHLRITTRTIFSAALLRHAKQVAALGLRQLAVTYSPTNQREIASSPTPIFGFFLADGSDGGGGSPHHPVTG